jgi:hypothetical protein
VPFFAFREPAWETRRVSENVFGEDVAARYDEALGIPELRRLPPGERFLA